jgi:anti-anti-sigma factor
VDEHVAADEGQARTTILTMPAEMDHYSSARIHEDVLAALEPGVSTVIMDLSRTTHCDTAGLGKIALARRLATSRHIGLRIVIPPASPVHLVLAPTGLGRVLSIYATLGAALRAEPSAQETPAG